MTQSTDFTPEDGAEFASLLGINEENNQSEVEQPTEVVETDDEETYQGTRELCFGAKCPGAGSK